MPKKSMKTSIKDGIYISLKIPSKLHELLSAEALYDGRSLAQMIRKFLNEAVGVKK